MTSFLDVTRLPVSFVLADGTDVADIIAGIRPAMEQLMKAGLLKTTDSFGFAMIDPSLLLNHDEQDYWRDPYAYICFVGGWGPDRDMFVANAVRKLLPHARTGIDTLSLRLWSARGENIQFQNVVESVDAEGNFPLGDFPRGGSVDFWLGGHPYNGAVSCYKETEDAAPAALILALIAGRNASADLTD